MLGLPRRAAASAAVRALSLHNAHTGEALVLPYAQGGTYLSAALSEFNRFLRDFRTGEAHPIDPAVLDQLHTLASITGSREPIQIISGYRSPATNQALRARNGGGVARHSLHLEGRAIDIRLTDVGLADLRDAAISLKAGGVGYYAQSAFVHVDTGPVRRW
jgi:uncharacterized protein YcbK (DUF882 family)